jgi:hypothetical protein
MTQKENLARFNSINVLLNVLVFLIPFGVLINNFSQQINQGYKLNYIYGFVSLILISHLITKINWSIAYKLNKFLVIGTIYITVLAILSSLVINPYTANLFLPGFNSEIVPLILLVIAYIYSQQNQYIPNKISKLVLFFSIFISNLFFILTTLTNLPIKLSELFSTNPNYYGLLNVIYLAILTSIYIKTDSSHKYWIRIAVASIIFLQLILAPLTALFSIAGAIILLLKNKFLNLSVTRFIVLSVVTIGIGIGFLTNLSGLNNIEYINTIRRDFTIGNNAKLHTLYGYGLGNTSIVGQFKYGNNYTKFLNRPLIFNNNVEDKQLLPNVELGIVELLVSGGLLYAAVYMGMLIYIAYNQKRISYYFYPMLVIIMTSLFFNPLNFLPIFLTLAIMSLLVL